MAQLQPIKTKQEQFRQGPTLTYGGGLYTLCPFYRPVNFFDNEVFLTSIKFIPLKHCTLKKLHIKKINYYILHFFQF